MLGASGSRTPIANAENMPKHASGKKSEPYRSRASNVDAAPAARGKRNRCAKRGTQAIGASINAIAISTKNMPCANQQRRRITARSSMESEYPDRYQSNEHL